MKAKFVLNKSKLLEQYNFLKGISDEVSYSLKTNPKVGQVLEENTDSLFTLHSTESLHTIKDKSKIIFVAQSLNKEILDNLFKLGIKYFIVDNESDLKILLDYISDNDCKINLLLRMRMKEHTIKTEKYFVFGMYSNQINELIPELRKNNKIEKLGLHFHKKTQNVSEWSFKRELEDVLDKTTIENIDVLNIGGGIPIKYKSHGNVNEVTHYIFDKIKELREWLNKNNIKMMVEPGRFLAAPCIKLETEITGIYDNNIIINCSVYNAAMDTFVAHTRLFVDGELEKGEPFTIKGCTPDSMDIFRYRVYLDNPKVGDKIIFLDAGAYTYSTDFCDLEKLETVIE
ncbi:MAG: decarboxylase [Candidatus Aenigmarchaeota archaeon]|nr:decarboxylase [Candidatus Aenigmarchaeota archaeon]